jgi:nucleoside-diphosphate-sugar epimerase
MTILVTGATGFLGQNLVTTLLDRGYAVRVLARSETRVQPLVARGAAVILGDISDVEAASAAMRGIDVVYHLAGRLYAPGVPRHEYYRTHVIGTQLLLACCREHSNLRQFVHVSTTGVLGVTGKTPAPENRHPAPTNAYEETKWLAEEVVRREISRGFPAVIARPGLVYGPGDLHLLGFFRAIERDWFRPIGDEPVWLHPIYIDDLTTALLQCGGSETATGQCFHLAGPQPATLTDLAATIATALGTSLPGGTIPRSIATLLAAAGDTLPASLRQRAPLTRSRLDFLTNSRVYDVSRARRVLGFAATTALGDGIDRAVAWYREHGYLKRPVTPPAVPLGASVRQ